MQAHGNGNFGWQNVGVLVTYLHLYVTIYDVKMKQSLENFAILLGFLKSDHELNGWCCLCHA